jgi:surface protein
MFQGATAFNQPIGSWNVSNVTDMGAMFAGASIFYQDLSGWNTSDVTYAEQIFCNCSVFDTPSYYPFFNIPPLNYGC